jgi:multiple sugar transport system substrate-binding protein
MRQSRRSVLQSLAFGTILALSLGGLPALAEEANEPKRIEFWHAMRGERGVLLEKLTRRFESQNPDIRVTLKAVLDPSPRLANDYAALYRSLLESLANRRPPDVAQLYENWSTQLQEVKALEPLQGELAETIADLQPSLKAGLVAKDGSIFSIPFNKSVWVLYANHDLLERCQLKAPQTWTELQAASRVISEKTSLPGLVFRPGVDLFSLKYLSEGGELLGSNGKSQFSSPLGVQSLSYWSDFVHKNRSAFASMQAMDVFGQGSAGFLLETTSKLGRLEHDAKIKLDVLRVPAGKRQTSLVAGTNLGVFAQNSAAEKMASARLIRFLTSPEVQAEWSQGSGYVPVRVATTTQPAYAAFLKANPHYQVGLSELAQASKLPEVSGWESVRGVLDDAILGTLAREVLAEPALRRAAEATEQLLNQRH